MPNNDEIRKVRIFAVIPENEKGVDYYRSYTNKICDRFTSCFGVFCYEPDRNNSCWINYSPVMIYNVSQIFECINKVNLIIISKEFEEKIGNLKDFESVLFESVKSCNIPYVYESRMDTMYRTVCTVRKMSNLQRK